MHCRPIRTLFIPLIIISACSQPEQGDRHSFRIVSEDGIPTALTTGGPRYDDELFEYERILTLDQDDNNPESLLTRPSLFLMGEKGRFYAMDTSQHRIAVFDADGQGVGSLGRAGSGPGEFNNALFLGLYGGSVNIYNRTMRRIEIFAPDGKLLSSTPSPDRNWTGRFFHYNPDDEVYVLIDRSRSVQDSFRVSISLYSDNGTPIGTVESDPVRMYAPYRGSDGPPRPVIPYRPVPLGYYMPGRGILMSISIEPVMRWYDFSGQLVKRIRIEGISIAMTSEAREHFRSEWNWRVESTPEMSGYAKKDERRACTP